MVGPTELRLVLLMGDDVSEHVGELSYDEKTGEYCFVYARNPPVEISNFPFCQRERGFRSSSLFSFFRNRMMKPSRPDFSEALEKYGITATDDFNSPEFIFEYLIKSGGTRQTDSFKMIGVNDKRGEVMAIKIAEYFASPESRALAQNAVKLFESLDLGDRTVEISDGSYWGEIRIEIIRGGESCVLSMEHYGDIYKIYSWPWAMVGCGSTPLEALRSALHDLRNRVDMWLNICDIPQKDEQK